MNMGKGRFGYWLTVSGLLVLVAQLIIRLVQLFNEANGFSGVFGFYLASSVITLVISSIIVYFILKAPKKVGLFAIVFFSLALISILIPAFSDSASFVQLVGGLMGYALLVSGSLLIYQESKDLTTS